MTSGSASLQRLQRSPAFSGAARAGYAVNGLLHLLIGGIAISVALGAGGEADQSGALGALSRTPGGAILLWIVVIGLAALGLWQIVQTVVASGRNPKKRWMARAKEAGKAVAYLAVAFSAFGFARGGGSNSEQDVEGFTGTLLASPLGRVAVLLVAAVALGVGGYFLYKGATEKFREDLDVPTGTGGRATVLLGKIGYIAKGAAIAIVGILFVVAAATANPEQAGGLDGALKALAALPFGAALLVLVGLGLIAYGVYCFVRARRARL
ncbi:MAG: hypothetical protein JWP66_290 [Naasia sp.]|nr:hypothetical protein [Naasia sp.]